MAFEISFRWWLGCFFLFNLQSFYRIQQCMAEFDVINLSWKWEIMLFRIKPNTSSVNVIGNRQSSRNGGATVKKSWAVTLKKCERNIAIHEMIEGNRRHGYGTFPKHISMCAVSIFRREFILFINRVSWNFFPIEMWWRVWKCPIRFANKRYFFVHFYSHIE